MSVGIKPERINCFPSYSTNGYDHLPWIRDEGLSLGIDPSTRQTIFATSKSNPYAGRNIKVLAENFPDKFRVVDLSKEITYRNGDYCSAYLPSGEPVLLVGKREVIRSICGNELRNITMEEIGKLQEHISSVFGGVKVVFPGIEYLTNCSSSQQLERMRRYQNYEGLFDLDMTLTYLHGKNPTESKIYIYDSNSVGTKYQEETKLIEESLISIGFTPDQLHLISMTGIGVGQSILNNVQYLDPSSNELTILVPVYPEQQVMKDYTIKSTSFLTQIKNISQEIIRGGGRDEKLILELQLIVKGYHELIKNTLENASANLRTSELFKSPNVKVIAVPRLRSWYGGMHCQTTA